MSIEVIGQDSNQHVLVNLPDTQAVDSLVKLSRDWNDQSRSALLRDVAFNRNSMNTDGRHVSPFNNGFARIGLDGITVKLIQGINEKDFKNVLSKAQRATTGIDPALPDETPDDWEEMMKGGLQAALETQVVVFEVAGVSRCCTHQLVRSRRAGFHQQSQRATYYGERPDVRMPESVWHNPRARQAFLEAMAATWRAYEIACEEDISYQDARHALMEGTVNYIMCEYTVKEFLAVYSYRACTMFNWEIVHVARVMGQLLIEAHPWIEPYVKISCEKSKRCTFQGWEDVEGQCDFPWANHESRTFKPLAHHRIRKLDGGG